MPGSKLPTVRILPMGSKTSKGVLVNPEFISGIYSTALPEDPNFFHKISREEIAANSKIFGQRYFAIENSSREIVGATSVFPALEFHDWYVSETLVIPNYRGKRYSGVSKKELANLLKREGSKTLFARTNPVNAASIKALRKAGFRKFKKKTEFDFGLVTFRRRI